MTLSKERLIQIILILTLVGVLVCAGAGIYNAMRLYQDVYEARTLITLEQSAEHAYSQYQGAAPEEARQALLAYLDLLGKMNPAGKREYYLDSGLTYARLALLEEKSGSAEKARAYFDKARKSFEEAGWQPYSDQKIRELIIRIDRLGPAR
jgi:hypothetical protein